MLGQFPCLLFFNFRCLSVEKLSIESRLEECETDYEQRLSIANDQVESLQEELKRYTPKHLHVFQDFPKAFILVDECYLVWQTLKCK